MSIQYNTIQNLLIHINSQQSIHKSNKMGIAWEPLQINLRVPGFVTSSFVRAFDAGPNVFLISSYGNLTCVALLESSTLELRRPPDKLSLDESCKEIIAVSQTIYAIDCSDNLYRLTDRIPEKYRKADDYRDDGRDKYFWKKIPGFSNVIAITGLQFGIIAIEKSKESFFLTAYDIKDQLIPMIFVPLGSITGEYFMTSFITTSVDTNLASSLLAERSTTSSDLVVFSKPSGWVYLFPIVCEFQDIKPVQLHFDRNLCLKAASIAADGKTIILSYDSGKIVLIFLDETTRTLCSSSFYLNTCFKTGFCTGSSEEILVLTSDHSELLLATIANRKSIKTRPSGVSLPGIRFLLFVNEVRPFLAFSCYGSVYKLTISSIEGEVVRNPSQVVKEISETGESMEQLTTDLAKVDLSLYAIENEQHENYAFDIALEGSSVGLKNTSPRTFNKSIWTVHIESNVNDEFYLKVVPLENHLDVDGIVSIDVANFIRDYCKSLKFSLVGIVAEDLRTLIVEIGCLELGDSDNPDVQSFISQKVNDILDKRKL